MWLQAEVQKYARLVAQKKIRMKLDEQRQKILEFMKEQKLMVLSYQSFTGAPAAAVVSFSENPDLSLYFGTFSTFGLMVKSDALSVKLGPH